MRDILTALEADEKIGNLEEEEVAIIEEIAEVLETRQKNKTHSIAKTNELFYAGTVVVTNRFGVKIKAAERNEPMWRRRLQNRSKS